MDAFQHVDSDRLLSFQTQAMEALNAIHAVFRLAGALGHLPDPHFLALRGDAGGSSQQPRIRETAGLREKRRRIVETYWIAVIATSEVEKCPAQLRLGSLTPDTLRVAIRREWKAVPLLFPVEIIKHWMDLCCCL
jgi:hypothetical protein